MNLDRYLGSMSEYCAVGASVPGLEHCHATNFKWEVSGGIFNGRVRVEADFVAHEVGSVSRLGFEHLQPVLLPVVGAIN